MKAIGQKLKELRLAAGQTIVGLSKECKTSIPCISNVETSTTVPSVELIVRLAAALGYKTYISFRKMGVENEFEENDLLIAGKVDKRFNK